MSRVPRNYYLKNFDKTVDDMSDTLSYIRRNSSNIDDIFDMLK